MYSYIDLARSMVSPSVYNKGLQDFLNGRVLKAVEMVLNNWREYKVIGNRQQEYLIRIPILHLALSSDRFTKSQAALNQSVSCDCEYFIEKGVCRHVVAVLASMEDEFINPHKKPKSEEKLGNEVMKNIFAADTRKKIDLWKDAIWSLFFGSGKFSSHLYEMLEGINKNQEEYQEFLDYLETETLKAVKQYESELKLITLIETSLNYNTSMWFGFWKKVIANISQKRKIELLAKIWLSTYLNNFTSGKDEVLEYLRSLDKESKSKLFEYLENKYPNNSQLWVEFAISCRYNSWLLKNLDKIDPETLIRIVNYLPDESERVEEHLYNRVRVWSDFLSVKDIDSLISVLDKWKKCFGMSKLLEDAVDYLKKSHPKKKKIKSY